MAYTTINKHTDYFSNKLWTGNGSTQNITGVGHTPDFVWIKKRTDADGARIFDAVRGATKAIFTNSTAAETTVATELSAFGSDGYTLGGSDAVNGNTKQYVGWNWKANGAGSANTDGSINTTSTSVNTTAGFSIVKWTGTGSAGTLGHGLTTTPKMIIVKNISDSVNWFVYHHSVITASATNKSFMTLNTTDSLGTNGSATTFTSVSNTTFGVGTDNIVNGSGDNMIAYVFAEKTGYSKFSSYTGTGISTEAPFIYTGFKPAFVLLKESTSTDNWLMMDNKRLGYNPRNDLVFANLNNAEQGHDRIDLLSNGFKINNDDGSINQSGQTYIYMSFGQTLVGSNNIPCTAR